MAAQQDTMATLQWLIESDSLEAARALDFCQERADSLQIVLDYAEDHQAPENQTSPVWAALGSRTAVFIYGVVSGAWLTVQVMHAVN